MLLSIGFVTSSGTVGSSGMCGGEVGFSGIMSVLCVEAGSLETAAGGISRMSFETLVLLSGLGISTPSKTCHPLSAKISCSKAAIHSVVFN